jgi:uncharacterized oxidoreductase
MSSIRINLRELEQFISTVLIRLNAPKKTADTVASSLVGADLRGHHSHGVLRVPIYREMIDEGAIDPVASPSHHRVSPTAIHVDGHSAFGQVVGQEGVNLGIDIAESHGTASVGICDATHLGRIGEWAERAASQGYLFAAFVNHQGGGKTVAPAGSGERRLGTNPMAFGVPTFDALPFPIVLDMATSQVAHGKIRQREKNGEPVPEAWTTRPDGTSVSDAAVFEAGEGALLPLGGRDAGYKGFGLSLISELFAGFVGDSLIASEADPDWTSNAAAFVLIDPLQYTTLERCTHRVQTLGSYLRETTFSEATPLGIGAKGRETYLPGEVEYRAFEQGKEHGVELSEGVVETLRDTAESLSVTHELPSHFH